MSTTPADVPDPPRKFYGLKPREFDYVNGPPRTFAPEEVPTEPDPGITSAPAGPITVEALRLVAAGDKPLLGHNQPATRANDVHGLLAANRQRALRSGEFALTPQPKRVSRRKRDYWTLVLISNVGILGFMALLGGFNLLMMLVGLGAGLFLTAALTWIMWFVMDDY